MQSNMKYTVILSAYHVGTSALDNMLNTERLNNYLVERCPDTLRAVGVFEGTPEQSFVVHTNSSNLLNRIVSTGLYDHDQICVLVSNNRTLEIALYNADGTRDSIGTRFAVHSNTPKNAHAYTVLNGEYWTVA